MFKDDRSYFQHRAEVETERAQEATEPKVARAHYQLAEAYLSKLTTTGPAETEPS